MFADSSSIYRLSQWGIRHDFLLDLVELQREGLVRVGSWQDTLGLQVDTHTAVVLYVYFTEFNARLRKERLETNLFLMPEFHHFCPLDSSHYVFTSIVIDPPGGEAAVPGQAGASGDDREQDDRGDHRQVPAIRHVQV